MPEPKVFCKALVRTQNNNIDIITAVKNLNLIKDI
jgi:hypothetical protein